MLAELIYNQPGHLIRRAHQLAWSVFMEETESLDLTPVQYAALVAIAANPGVDATRLSQQISFDRATIGNVLDRMEKKGLIARTAHKSDRRAKQTHVTPAGMRQIKAVETIVPRISDRIFGRLKPKERKEMLRLLRIVLDLDRASNPPLLANKNPKSMNRG